MHQYDPQIDELIARHEGSWQRGYHKFPSVVQRLGLRRGAEIGVAFGGHAQAILEQGNVQRLYAVDSYRHRPEYDDPMNLPQPVFDRLFERTGQRLARFGDRAQQIRLDSVEAAAQIDDTLDFVYIDGDHSYQGIRDDLAAWFPKVRVGGIIAGHDYGQPAFPGVRAVADAFFQRFGLEVHHEGAGVWWATRPATSVAVVMPAPSTPITDQDCSAINSALQQAGLAEGDQAVIVGPAANVGVMQQAIKGSFEVKTIHDKAAVQPWQATRLAAKHTACPLMMPIDCDHLPAPGSVHALRSLVVHSGARAAALYGEQATQDYDLRSWLNTPAPPMPVGRTMVFSQSWRDAESGLHQHLEHLANSDRLLGWCVLMQMLASGGRMALAASDQTDEQPVWTVDQCRYAAKALCSHAHQLGSMDLIRLVRPDTASQWLNQLGHKPVRLLESVRPIDHPVVYITPNILDRLVHKIRRGIKQVA